MTDFKRDPELISAFVEAVSGYGPREIARMVDGVTSTDVVRWRNTGGTRLSENKRRALLAYLERARRTDATADADVLSDEARNAYEFLTTTLRAQRGRHPDADPELIKDAIRGAIEEARARGWPLGPLYELLGRVESGDF